MAAKEVSIVLDDRTIIIKKVPLRHYADLIRAFQKIATHFVGINEITTDEMLAMIPDLVERAFPELSEFISAATLGSLTPAQVGELDIAELTDIATAVLEVNKVERVVNNIKKLMELRGTKTPAPTAPESENSTSTTGSPA